jgi:hypothetical protein
VKPVTTNQLGVRSIEEQVASTAKNANVIRTDIGTLIPPPRPFLKGEPIMFDTPDGEVSGIVREVALDANRKQSVIALMPNGSTFRVTDDMNVRHAFDNTPLVPDVKLNITSAGMKNLNTINPQVDIPIVHIPPGQLSEGIDILKGSGVKASMRRLPDGVYLNIENVVKGKFNEREAEAITQNLIRSKLSQLRQTNILGGPACIP